MSDFKPHVLILGLINESNLGMGRQLLASCIIGEENEKIRKLKLDRLVHFGSLPLYEKKDVFELVDVLINKKFIEFVPLATNRYIRVLGITEKGKEELKNPSQDINGSKDFSGHYKRIEKVTDNDRSVFEKLGDLLLGLSDEQKKAVIHDSKSVLCIAGAGSGKTRVLTKRAWFLATLKSVPQEKILAITFTRKARKEMQGRLEKILPNNTIDIETFNSFCEKILRKKEKEVYDKKYNVLDYKTKIKLILKILNELGEKSEDVLELYYSDKKFLSTDKKVLFFGFVNDIFSLLDYQRNNAINDQKLNDLIGMHENFNLSVLIKNITKKIRQYKEEYGFRDYTDQIVHIIDYFKSSGDIPEYEHILIDEYQDINSLQFDLIKLLNPGNVFAVGDPRQSIYGWRGSRIDYILDFEQLYDNASILQLETNYRSTEEIVKLSNHVVKGMKLPDLRSFNSKDGESIKMIKHPDDDAESLFVAHSIPNLDCNREEIFVLARTNKQIEKIAEKLDSAKIKYVKRSIEGTTGNKEAREDEVTLSTIHAIKGMEADVVYFVGANSKNHPSKANEHPILETVKVNDVYDKFEEELRLFYVALSRARKKLIINYSGSLSSFMNDDARKMLKINESVVEIDYKVNKNGSRLFNELRNWRYEKASKMNVPPYQIFNDRTLNEICDALPTSFDQLADINGFGDFKIRRYGNDVIRIVLDFA